MKVRNWDKWQTYRKDRQQPPWIKLYRALLRDPNWIALSDAERGQLVSMWMLAADRDGEIPDDPKLAQRMCFLDKTPDFKRLSELGFLDAIVTPTRRQPDANVTPQIRGEEKIEIDSPKRASQIEENWQPKPETLSSLKTNGGFVDERIRSELERFRNHHRSKGNVFKDKDAAFRNWMLKSRDFSNERGGNGVKPYVGSWKPSFKPEPEIKRPPPEVIEAQLAKLKRAKSETETERESSQTVTPTPHRSSA
jgi:hypothetical protein